MATRMLQRRGTAAEWAAQNPVLSNGEIGFETDTKIIRVGDGVTPWNDLTLPYVMTGGGTMTGPLSLVAPTQNAHGARKQDVDSVSQVISELQLGLRQTVKFTASGTFSKASYPWLRAIRARVQGAGGGAGGAAAGTASAVGVGRGGRPGVYAESVLLASALAASVTVTVGAGGVGGTGSTGGAIGGDSSFGTHVIGIGGQVSPPSFTTSSVLVTADSSQTTVGAVGDLIVIGTPGTACVVAGTGNNMALAGGGGSSHLGGGGAAGRNDTSAGNDAPGFGGGGGATATRLNGAALKGGDGGAGIVIVELYA